MDSTPKTALAAGESPLCVPDEVFKIAIDSLGTFFEPICRVERRVNAKGFLDANKAFKHAEILERFTPLAGEKVLEIGSGFGTNLAVWLRHYQMDAYGVEPGGEGFNQGYIASRKLLAANGLDPERVINSPGEALPFPDESFDIVYSSNVLEHTDDPRRVVAEAFRVLKPGGLFHMEAPNHLSYFEGHYLVVMPPLLWKWILPFWIKWVIRRDPAFAHTLRTEINPFWCRRVVRGLSRTYDLELITLGEDLFLERLSQPFVFEKEIVAGRLQRLIGALKKLNIGNWVGRLIVALQGHYPIYMTVRKGQGRPRSR
jgi:SAM-dependent methyltransferase